MNPPSEPASDPAGGSLPTAVRYPKRLSRLPLVWVVPLLAAVIGITIAAKAFLERGPEISIDFRSGEGIEPGKTKIRYRSIDVGVVEAIELTTGHQGVRVHAAMARSATALLAGDSRFWVVRPRLDVSGVSGLGTLLSGSYIGMDVGHGRQRAHAFTGLESPPVVESDVPGRDFVLHGDTLGSLEAGSPVHFRHLPVGRVTKYLLDADGRGVTVGVFIASPFEQLVTNDARFWHASGVDVAVEATGVRVSTESLAAILGGGIAFEAPPESRDRAIAPAGYTFRLAANREQAMKTPDLSGHRFVLYFTGSLRGLAVGSPVDLNGVEVGEVTSIDIEYEPSRGIYRYPVEILVYQRRIRSRYRAGSMQPQVDPSGVYQFVERLIEHGLRGQLRSASLITGSKCVGLDFFPRAPPTRSDPTHEPMEVPTVAGGLEDLQQSLAEITAKVNAMPLERIGKDTQRSLVSLHAALEATTRMVQHADADVAPQLAGALVDARRAINDADGAVAVGAPLRVELLRTLEELTRAGESLRDLADYLERHPEAVVRGKLRDAGR